MHSKNCNLYNGGVFACWLRQLVVVGALILLAPIFVTVLQSPPDLRAPPELAIGARLGLVVPDIIAVIPHEESCYTQGLVFNDVDGYLYESCGNYGESLLRRVCPLTGLVLEKSALLAPDLFAEGIHIVDDKLLLLTWREKQVLVFDWRTLQLQRSVAFDTHTSEGWGVSGNGTMLVVSDGSHWLHFWDQVEFAESKKNFSATRVAVNDAERNIDILGGLNELEFVGQHELLANVYGWEVIARIDARSGAVAGYYDVRGILKRLGDPAGRPEVMNGIAFDKRTGDLFFTGKWWRSMFKFNIFNITGESAKV